MIFNQHRRAIAVFSERVSAETAFDQLVFAGFPLSKVFLLSQAAGANSEQAEMLLPDPASTQLGDVTGTATGLKKGLIFGNMVGGATGLLLGLGLLALPGMGHVVLISAITLTLISGGVCTAAGGVIGVLVGLGLTAEQAKAYAKQVAEGKSLLVVEGIPQEILCAERILRDKGISTPLPKFKNKQF